MGNPSPSSPHLFPRNKFKITELSVMPKRTFLRKVKPYYKSFIYHIKLSYRGVDLITCYFYNSKSSNWLYLLTVCNNVISQNTKLVYTTNISSFRVND